MFLKQIIFFVGAYILFQILFGNFTQFESNFSPGSEPVSMTDPAVATPQQSLQMRALIPATPTPGGSGGGTFPNPTPVICRAPGPIAVSVLVDESNTMNTGSRLLETKRALKRLGGLLRPDDIIGIQAFSDPGMYGGVGLGAREMLAINTYSVNRSILDSSIDSMGTTGETHMKDGFTLAKQKIFAAQASSQLQNRSWIMIVMSDGVPNDRNGFDDGPNQSQDPRYPTDISQEIKNRVTRMVSIWIKPGYFGPGQESYGRSLMQSLAFGPGQNFFEAENADGIPNIWNIINRSVCNL